MRPARGLGMGTAYGEAWPIAEESWAALHASADQCQGRRGVVLSPHCLVCGCEGNRAIWAAGLAACMLHT